MKIRKQGIAIIEYTYGIKCQSFILHKMEVIVKRNRCKKRATIKAIVREEEDGNKMVEL